MNDKFDFFNLFNSSDKFNIIGHIRPDADCVGAQVAMYHVLTNLGKKCFVIDNYDFPQNLIELTKNINRIKFDQVDKTIPLICFDCSDIDRLGEDVKAMFPVPFANIDHHISNTKFAQNNIVDTSAASTTEIISREIMRNDIKIDSVIASMLYLGIMTDTGRFAYEKTSEETFKIAQFLVHNGANTFELYKIIFSNERIERMKLLEIFLHNMAADFKNKICTSFLTEDDFIQTNASWFDSEGFVDYTRSIQGIDVGMYIEYKKDQIKISLRSDNKKHRLDLFAAKYHGGGHPCAAGIIFKNPSENFVDKIKAELINYITNAIN